MGNINFGFYNYKANPPKKYDANDYASILDGVLTEGFFNNYYLDITSTSYNPIIIPFNPKGTSSTENSMQVMVQPFRAWLHHTWNYNDINQIYEIENASVLNGRIDVFVVKIDTKARKNTIEYIVGTPNPVNDLRPPDISNTETIFYFPIAYVYLPRRTYNITSSNIISVIGMESTTIKVGNATIQLQGTPTASAPVTENGSFLYPKSYIQDILDRFEDFKTDNSKAFKEWFDSIKDILKSYTIDQVKQYKNFDSRVTDLEATQGNVIFSIDFPTSMIGYNIIFHKSIIFDGIDYSSRYSDETYKITSAHQKFYLSHIGNYTIKETKTNQILNINVPYYGEYEGSYVSGPLYIFKNSVCQIQPVFGKITEYINPNGTQTVNTYDTPFEINGNKIYIKATTMSAPAFKTKSQQDPVISISYFDFILGTDKQYKHIHLKGRLAIKTDILNLNSFAGSGYIIKIGDITYQTHQTELKNLVTYSYPYILNKNSDSLLNNTYMYHIYDINIDKQLDTYIYSNLRFSISIGAGSNDHNSFDLGSNFQFEELSLYE